MNIQQLEGFLAVAKQLSFTRAAKELFITQPTLTKQLKELEKDLGCVLFIRTTRSVQLTQSGRICLKYAERLLKDAEQMKAAVSDDIQRRFTSIRIGYVTVAHVPFVEKGLAQIEQKYPNINIHIEKGNPQDLVEKLKNGSLDCAFLHLPSIKNQKQLHYDTVCRGGLVARIPKAHHLSCRKEISCMDLDGEALITGKLIAPYCFSFMLEKMEEAGSKPLYLEGSTEESISILTKSKKAISLTSVLSPHSPGFSYIPVTEFASGFDLVIARGMTNDNPSVYLFCNTVMTA